MPRLPPRIGLLILLLIAIAAMWLLYVGLIKESRQPYSPLRVKGVRLGAGHPQCRRL